jgi:tetratricopeptide (TPR) repeat protein/tRNA A-37 threonylcarbamoyl transferase component Bud32
MSSPGAEDETTRAGGSDTDDREELERGASVGRYVVIEQVGRGGMATVYRAYDPKLRRDVALKMLRRDLVDAVGESRLVAEAQAMARLSHPNVVVIYDVIAARGGVVFAMELVEGGTLADWLASEPTPARILEVFIAAGRGLATAHAAQLIHRDFKPSNVLMGAGLVPKVADFGLVRFGDGDETWTRGDGIVGTPRYMPPEQLEGRELDARADQYAFCVALWEALAHRPLFEGDPAALRVAKREPPTTLPASVAPAIATAIVRGLAARPADRWPDMPALLTELAEQPARARRRRARIAGVVVLVPLAAAASWSLRPTERCKDELDRLTGVWDPQAERAPTTSAMRAKAEAQIDDYANAWLDRQRAACEATWLRGTQSVAQLDLRMACLWNARARLAAAIEVVQRDDAPPAALELIASLPELDRCDDLPRLEAETGRPHDPQQARAIDEVRGELARITALREVGHHDEAEPLAKAALDRARALDDPALHVEAAIALGVLDGRLARYADAEALLGEALSIALESGDRMLELEAASSLAFYLTHELAAPERAYWPAVIAAGLADAPEVDPAPAAEAFSSEGAMLRGLGRYAEAEAAHRRALALRIAAFGEDDFRVGAARTNLGLVLYDLGDYTGAVEEHARALEIWRQALGDEHPRVATARGNLGNALEQAGRHDDAVTELRASLELRLALVGPDHPDVGISRNDLGIALTSVGQLREAEREIAEALRIWTNSHGPESRLLALGYNNLGLAIEAQGRLDEAGAAFRRSAALVERIMGPRHPLLPRIWGNVARTAFATGKLDEAETFYRRALELHRAVVAQNDDDAMRLEAKLAEVELARGETR